MGTGMAVGMDGMTGSMTSPVPSQMRGEVGVIGVDMDSSAGMVLVTRSTRRINLGLQNVPYI